MKPFSGASIPAVWLQAAEYLDTLRKRTEFDLFLEVRSPDRVDDRDKQVWLLLDRFLEDGNGFPINTVAETIFPMSEYRRHGKEWVIGKYFDWFDEIRKGRTDGRWGSYAQRLVRQWDREGVPFSPLGDLVDKIVRHHAYKACYELGLHWPLEADLAIYDPARDRKPYYGNLPCLSHVSIKVDDGTIRLHGLYRSHNYVQRAFGNLVGLTFLQQFIANETGLKVGTLTVHSTFARLDTGGENGEGRSWGTRDVRVLLRDCRQVYEAESTGD